MEIYYKCTVKVSFEDKKGNLKFKKENYLVSAISPTDIDAKMAEYLKPTEYEIVGINVSNIMDVIK